MARIRTIKPEIYTSEQVVSCSLPARLLFIGLFNFSDDHGVHVASCVRAKAEILPCDNFSTDEIKGFINELIAQKLLQEYCVNGQDYWLITGFIKHQKIDKPTYRYPLPQEESASNSQLLDDNSPTTRRIIDDSSTTEWKGREWKGREWKEREYL